MPEGDTVWLTGRRLHKALAGRVLTRTDFRVPALATVDLSGRAVLEVATRGKHLLTRVEDGLTLHSHLRMDGRWQLYPAGTRWTGGPAWQVRVALANPGWQAVGYRLPLVELVQTGQESEVVGHLGPDLLGPDWDASEAVRGLTAQPDREVGPALLDQRNLAGIGNLYKAEVLFLRGVSPWTPVRAVPDLAAVVELAHRLLTANKGRWNQATTGTLRPDRKNYVFERAGKPCLRCATPICRREQGAPPHSRLTYWCPHCQPPPA